MVEATRLTVCACTHRRPEGLRALLAGLAAERFAAMARPRFDVVIVDNEGSEAARASCAQIRQQANLAVRYVHEPKRGIPHARNACLDHVAPAAEFFAMIDDDEVPEPDWLEQLLLAQARTGADVVRGAVVPVFPDGAPAWIQGGDFFGWPKPGRTGAGDALADGAELASASSNNVLVRCAAVRALSLRFDPTLAFTGGTDALFFRQMKLAGCKIVYGADARVREIVPPERASFAYLWRAHYKQGCNKVPRKLRLEKTGAGPARRVRLAAKRIPRECAEIGGGALAVARSLVTGHADMGRLSGGLLRMAKGLGGLAGLLGLRFAHYR
ncbi:MAG: glycosyltransferase family 2 protein [Geminicoccaceae bacterium]